MKVLSFPPKVFMRVHPNRQNQVAGPTASGETLASQTNLSAVTYPRGNPDFDVTGAAGMFNRQFTFRASDRRHEVDAKLRLHVTPTSALGLSPPEEITGALKEVLQVKHGLGIGSGTPLLRSPEQLFDARIAPAGPR